MLNSICKWNKDRNNVSYDINLEYTMLAEELQEYLLSRQKAMLDFATAKGLDPHAETTFTNLTEDEQSVINLNTRVNEADALADLIFVATGSLYKLANGNEDAVRMILSYVIEANEAKGSATSDGKIIKPEGFVGPEDKIRGILYE